MAGTPFLIHGLDDATTGQANLMNLQKFDKSRINLLLTHTVDVFLDIGHRQVDLSFSGHSHGGQVRLPFLGPIITHTMLGKEFASGVISYKGAVCAVSRGMGSSRYLKIRLLCRPQALLIDLSGDEGSKR